ncbi:MAG TPA: capsid cement protein, partial [Kribbella sp.]
ERADGTTSVDTAGVWNLSVKGVDGSGNSAVAVGDILYYVAADTPKLSKKATGVRYGYAMAAITSGSTATIPVKLGY